MVGELEGMLRAIDVKGGLLRVHADDGKKYLCKVAGVGNVEKTHRYVVPKVTDKQKHALVEKTLMELKGKGKSADILKEDCVVTTKFVDIYEPPYPCAKYSIKFYQIVEDLGEV